MMWLITEIENLGKPMLISGTAVVACVASKKLLGTPLLEECGSVKNVLKTFVTITASGYLALKLFYDDDTR